MGHSLLGLRPVSHDAFHGGLKDIGNGWILEFRDPDSIALELVAPKDAGW